MFFSIFDDKIDILKINLAKTFCQINKNMLHCAHNVKRCNDMASLLDKLKRNGFMALFTMSGIFATHSPKVYAADNDKIPTEYNAHPKKDALTAMRTVRFYEAHAADDWESTDAFYNPGTGVIFNNLVKKETEFGRWLSIVHEVHHRDDYTKGLFNRDMSPEQFFKLNAHSEISAKVASVLAFRQEYINASNKEDFLKNAKENLGDKYGEMEFYIAGIKSGIINPVNSSKEEFAEDMKFIVNTSFTRWINGSLLDYQNKFGNSLYNYLVIKGITGVENDKNFREGLSQTYTFGGLDLSQYLYSSDLRIPANVQSQMHKIYQESKAATYKRKGYFEIFASKEGKPNPRQLRKYKDVIDVEMVDLSPNSNVMINQYNAALERETQNTEGLAKLTAANEKIKKSVEERNIKQFSYNIYDNINNALCDNGIQLGKDWNYKGLEEHIINSIAGMYGENVDYGKLFAAIKKNPRSVIKTDSKKYTGSRHYEVERSVEMAINTIAYNRLSDKQIEILCADSGAVYENSFNTIAQAYRLFDSDGKLKPRESSKADFYSHSERLIRAEENAFIAATYLQDESDRKYLIDALTNSGNHFEFNNSKEIQAKLFNPSITREDFLAYKDRHEQTNALVSTLMTRKSAVNADIKDSREKVSDGDVKSVARFLLANYSLEDANKIAQAMVTEDSKEFKKSFGIKKFSEFLHTKSLKDFDYRFSPQKLRAWEKEKAQDVTNMKASIRNYAEGQGIKTLSKANGNGSNNISIMQAQKQKTA